MKTILSVSKLSKNYDSYRAVDSLTFSIKEGEIFALLGPNGAGKTSTIQMLLGLTIPDKGQINYFGRDFAQNREWCLSKMNYSSAYARLQGRLTVWQNLRIYAGLYQVKNYQQRIDQLLELLEIEECKNKLFWHLSSGQQTRVTLAKALINKPKLLLLDEPTASLDPDIVNKINDLLLRLKQEEQVSMLYTSHNMDEVTRLCDRVLFLEKGRQVALDTPLNLTKMVKKASLIISFDAPMLVMKSYLKKKALQHRFLRPQLVDMAVEESAIISILFDLKKLGIWITDFEVKKPNLEDVFLTIARKGANELRSH